MSVHGAVDRSIEGLALGQVRAGEDLKAMLAYDELSEFDQQYQLPISGSASSAIVWQELEITFDWQFFNATEQRDSAFTVPTFTHGAVIDSGGPVLVTACVREWKINDADTVTGAVVAVGVCAPGSPETEFSGLVHLVFQGYGSPMDPGTEG